MLFDMEIYTSLDAFQWFFCITHNFLFKTVCDCVPHHTLFAKKKCVQWKANSIVKQIVHDVCAIRQLVKECKRFLISWDNGYLHYKREGPSVVPLVGWKVVKYHKGYACTMHFIFEAHAWHDHTCHSGMLESVINAIDNNKERKRNHNREHKILTWKTLSNKER
jgi:hypothetical protein